MCKLLATLFSEDKLDLEIFKMIFKKSGGIIGSQETIRDRIKRVVLESKNIVKEELEAKINNISKETGVFVADIQKVYDGFKIPKKEKQPIIYYPNDGANPFDSRFY